MKLEPNHAPSQRRIHRQLPEYIQDTHQHVLCISLAVSSRFYECPLLRFVLANSMCKGATAETAVILCLNVTLLPSFRIISACLVRSRRETFITANVKVGTEVTF